MDITELSFNEDGKFKIMQIADVQEQTKVSPDTVKLITLAVKREKPDLVIFTGDQIYGISPSYRIGNTEENVRNVIKQITAPVEEMKIPFTVTFGNHDSQCGLSNPEQSAIYEESPYFIHGKYRNENDTGTFSLKINSSDKTKPVFMLYIIDSNGQAATGEYLPVSEEQLRWLKDEQDSMHPDSGNPLPALVFQHIPVPEYYFLLKRVPFGTKGAVEAFRTHRHEYYVLPEPAVKSGGFMHESPAVPDKNSGEFELLKEKGNILGLFVGHDHNNSFTGTLDGITLGYTQGAGFNVYGPKRNRGVRIFDLDENTPGSFSTHTLTFGELTQDRVSAPLKEFVLTHIPTSMEQIKRLALIAAVSGASALCGAAYLYKKHR